MRRALSSVVLAAAAFAASSCATGVAPPPPPPDETTLRGEPVVLEVNHAWGECSLPKDAKGRARAVINWDQYNPPATAPDPKEVVWKRGSATKHLYFVPADDEKHPEIFGLLAGRLPEGKPDRRSGTPSIPANWNGWTDDADGDPESYTFRYVVVHKGKECDPEICIRKSGSGCSD